MFTLPPWPPKDYVLLPVARGQLSSSEITPLALPRSTQSNLGQYLYPVFYKDSERVTPEIKDVHPTIVENCLRRARAWWVDKPGLYNFHKMSIMTNLAGGENNDPVYQHKEKVFNRPFSLETDCIEFLRLQKLQKKADKECEAKCQYMTGLQQAELIKQKEEEALKIVPCEWPPPFWWKDGNSQVDSRYQQKKLGQLDVAGGGNSSGGAKTWQEQPSFFRVSDDPCIRRREFLLVGQPFRNEGCNWYYNNYPPPKFKIRPQRFSK